MHLCSLIIAGHVSVIALLFHVFFAAATSALLERRMNNASRLIASRPRRSWPLILRPPPGLQIFCSSESLMSAHFKNLQSYVQYNFWTGFHSLNIFNKFRQLRTFDTRGNKVSVSSKWISTREFRPSETKESDWMPYFYDSSNLIATKTSILLLKLFATVWSKETWKTGNF